MIAVSTTPPPSEEVERAADGEDEDVLAWRVARLTELDFEYPAALELVRAGVDWHDAARLRAAGASCDQCLRMLL